MTARRDPAGKWINYRRDGTPMLPVGQRLIPDPEPDQWARSDKDSDPTRSPTCHHHASPTTNRENCSRRTYSQPLFLNWR